MAAFDELSVNIGADTAGFSAGMDSAERSLSSFDRAALRAAANADLAGDSIDDLSTDAFTTAAAMQALEQSTEDAGDEIGRTGRKAGVATGGFITLSGAASTLNFSIHGLSAATLSVLIPALVALSTTLVPLAATVVGLTAAVTALAGAFGLVVGSGILAFGQQRAEQNEQQLQQVNERIEALKTLREEEGELSDAQQDTLANLKEQKDELEDTTSVSGALEQAFGDLRAELLPIIADFGDEFIPLIRDTLNAIPDFTRAILNAAGNLQPFRDALRELGGLAQTAIPALVSRLADLARNSLPGVINAAQWLVTNGGNIFDAILRTTKQVNPLLQQLGGAFGDALPSINRFGTAVLQQLVPALSDGIRGFGNLLDRVLEFSRSQAFEKRLTALQQGFNEIRPELEQFLGQLKDIIMFVTSPEFIEGLTGFADAFLDVLNGFIIPALKDAIELTELFLSLFGGGGEAATPIGGFDEIGGNAAQRTSVASANSAFSDANTGTGNNQTNVTVEVAGDTDVIDERATRVIEERENRATRNTGGTQSP